MVLLSSSFKNEIKSSFLKCKSNADITTRCGMFGCAVWLVLGRLSSQTCFRKPFHIFQAFPPKAGQGEDL
ncbi:hypothetical protein ES332_D04G179000v1 [Gossypium tomentosum]|uniref:Uncharacterized protein n=1 Tax=Gossypium tomentosum TaxID=34277 RepID=A0A5D2LF66_GOSTO|nr:hypothetical protein ES332_D04G179000v1 [Gossypium tomentosum]TYH77788.1 hypothetical protein ES332_D04G179000v1 [Gossypium tomentosum]